MAFPATRLLIKTEILIDGSWVDITSYVRGLGTDDGEIKGTRGGADERTQVAAASYQIALNNRDGRFSNRNPTGPYYRKLGRNTPAQITIQPNWTAGAQRDGADTFTRSSASTWTTADTGGAWSHVGTNTVLDANFTTSGTEGSMAVPVAAGTLAMRRSYLGELTVPDGEQVVTFKAPQATGAALEVGITTRASATASDRLVASLETDNSVNVKIYNRGLELLGTALVLGLTHTGTGQPLRIRARRVGHWLMARVWIAANAEPSTWHLTVYDTGSNLTKTGSPGVIMNVPAANSNARPLAITYDNYASTTEVVRIVGEIAQWPPRWKSNDVWTPVTIAGPLRRYTQGEAVIESPLIRILKDKNPASLWPMEDKTNSDSLASAIPGQPSMRIFDSAPTFEAAGPPGLASMTQFNDNTGVRGQIATDPDLTAWAVHFVVNIPDEPGGDTQILNLTIRGGTYGFWVFTLFPGSPSTIGLEMFDHNGSTRVVLFTMTFAAGGSDEPYGKDLSVWVFARQNGGNFEYEFNVGEVLLDGASNGKVSGSTAGTLGYPDIARIPNDYDHVGWKYGALAIFNTDQNQLWGFATPDSEVAIAAAGFRGEHSAYRFQRLCDENGIAYYPKVDYTESAAMGAQQVDRLITLLQQCADVEQGILCEERNLFGLRLVTRQELYNQTPVELAYGSSYLSGEIRSTDDDQYTHNDVTAERIDGSSYRVVQETGRLNVNEPSVDPDGVGRYARGALRVNAYLDEQLPSIASWQKHLGTYDDHPRYPGLEVEFERTAWTGNHALWSQYADLDVGGMTGLSGLPAWMPPDPVALMIRGYAEKLNQVQWKVDSHTVPGDPWTVATWDNDTTAKWDTAGCQLGADVTSTGTSLLLVTDVGKQLWTEDAGQFPFDIGMEGERIRVDSIAHTAFAFVSAGTVTHDNNASVTPGTPAGRAAGNLLLLFAAIRNSGTGTVNTPAGYTLLAPSVATNIAIFGRIATNTAADIPLVSFTGGVANADTSAQIACFSGLITDISKLFIKFNSALNGSAQDIAVPGLSLKRANCLIIAAGWKQDDWTSVAVASGMTAEIGEPDTTTGDDQGIVWDYLIQTTATKLTGTSFVVTGGAAAISRAIILAIGYDTQTATVTRSRNSVVKAQTANTRLGLWTPFRWAR